MTATKPANDPSQSASRDVLASLPRQDRHKPKGQQVRESKVSRWRAYVLIGVHVAIGLHVWHWLATGETITPVEPSEAMQTVELGKINAGFILFLSLIASTLLFGRFFCGWACHVVALQDLCAWLLKKVGWKPRPVRSRLLVFAPWVVGGYMFLWPIVHAWLWATFGEANGWTWLSPKAIPEVGQWNWELQTSEFWETFPGWIMAIGTVLVVGFLIVWWLGAKGFCTYGCPYGAFFATADRFAPVRIKVNDDCEHCGHCTSVCTSNVRVHEEVAKHGQIVDPGCMKCLDCVSVCPKDALSVGFTMPKPFTMSQQRIKARADFVWWEELLMAVVAVFTVQFVFRRAWFGEAIPFLMAVGLGVITAVFTLLFVRLFAKREVTFQQTVLKVDGKRTGVGHLVLLLLGGWLLFSAHTAYAKSVRDEAMAMARVPLNASFYSRADFVPAQASMALEQVERARSWLLVSDPLLREVHGMLKGALGDKVAAGEILHRTYLDNGRVIQKEAMLALAFHYLNLRQHLPAAEELLMEVLRLDGNNRMAPAMLQQVKRLRKQ